MRKSLIVVLPLVLLSSVFADGSAHAQCAPEDKIYIDPRLVPQGADVSAVCAAKSAHCGSIR
jgi:hypothetical protein